GWDGRVGVAVGGVRALPAVEAPARGARFGVGAELGDGGLRAPAAPFGLREEGLGLVDGDREQLAFGLEAPAVGALLQVRAVPAVQRGDLDALGVDADG